MSYLDQLVTREDALYAPLILRVGNAKTISALGPIVYDDVLRAAQTDTDVTSGVIRRSSRQAALGAMGLWIDPDNKDFSEQEKAAMTRILVDALLMSEQLPFAAQYRTMEILIEALGHSDDPAVARTLTTWMAKAPSSPRRTTAEAAAAVERRAQKD